MATFYHFFFLPLFFSFPSDLEETLVEAGAAVHPCFGSDYYSRVSVPEREAKDARTK